MALLWRWVKQYKSELWDFQFKIAKQCWGSLLFPSSFLNRKEKRSGKRRISLVHKKEIYLKDGQHKAKTEKLEKVEIGKLRSLLRSRVLSTTTENLHTCVQEKPRTQISQDPEDPCHVLLWLLRAGSSGAHLQAPWARTVF